MPASPRPIRSAPTTASSLRLYVLFTDLPRTRAALRHAQLLSRELHASITLLVLQQVPYPLPLDRPPIATTFLARELALLAALDPSIRVQLCCCRDARAAAPGLLPPGAIVIIAAGSWFHRKFHKLAAELTRAGCSVIHTGNTCPSRT